MLNARNFTLLAVFVAIASIAGMMLRLLQPPDRDGRGRDSYGTRWYGHRGIFDLLEALGANVERGLVPPTGYLREDTQLVFWAPDEMMARIEPEYLARVSEWIHEGGSIVIAPVHPSERDEFSDANEGNEFLRDTTVMEELGLFEVEMSHAPDRMPDMPEPPAETQEEKIRRAFEENVPFLRPKLLSPVPVRAEGDLASLGEAVRALEIPLEDIQTIDLDVSAEPAGRIYYVGSKGEEHTLVAVYRLGEGSATIVAEPAMFSNAALRQADNAALAAHLLSAGGRSVVFDEFYHGLTIRGNVFWLMTQRAYGVLALMLVAVAGLRAWRNAVYLGPPLPERTATRRTVAEYVEAMARLFERAKSRHFMIEEFKSGMLWRMRRQLHLGPSHENVEAVTHALARTDAARAARFEQGMIKLDVIAKHPREFDPRPAIETAREVSECF